MGYSSVYTRIVAIGVFFMVVCEIGSTEESDHNMCWKQEMVNSTKKVQEWVLTKVEKWETCKYGPCWVTKFDNISTVRNKPIQTQENVSFCCDGFKLNVNKKCVACQDGFYGPSCNQTCTCSNLSHCNPVNGSCVWDKLLVIGLAVLLLVFITLPMVLFYFYRVRKLRNELASVTYNCSGAEAPCENSGFENRVYDDKQPMINRPTNGTVHSESKKGGNSARAKEPLPERPTEAPNSAENDSDDSGGYSSVQYQETVCPGARVSNQLYYHQQFRPAPPSYETVITEVNRPKPKK